MQVKFERFWALSDKEVFVNGKSVGLLHVTKYGWGADKKSPSQNWVFRSDVDSELSRKIASKMKSKFTSYSYYKDIKADVLNAISLLEEEVTTWKHDAPYNSQFLGAQPARAGQDY